MKNFRTLGAALVLMLVLAAPTFAGIIECGVVPPPPPPPSEATTVSEPGSVAVHIETGDVSTCPITEAALSLLEGVLALF